MKRSLRRPNSVKTRIRENKDPGRQSFRKTIEAQGSLSSGIADKTQKAQGGLTMPRIRKTRLQEDKTPRKQDSG